MNRYDIVLDLDKSNVYKRYMPVIIRQGDKGGCDVAATIKDHGKPFANESLTPYLTAKLPSGSYCRQRADWVDGIVVVSVDETHFAAELGLAKTAYFEFRDGDSLIATTQDFPLKTIECATDGEVAEPYDSAIEDAIERMNELVDGFSTLSTEDIDALFD